MDIMWGKKFSLVLNEKPSQKIHFHSVKMQPPVDIFTIVAWGGGGKPHFIHSNHGLGALRNTFCRHILQISQIWSLPLTLTGFHVSEQLTFNILWQDSSEYYINTKPTALALNVNILEMW